MSDVVSRCTTTYNNSEISAVKSEYKPEENIELVF